MLTWKFKFTPELNGTRGTLITHKVNKTQIDTKVIFVTPSHPFIFTNENNKGYNVYSLSPLSPPTACLLLPHSCCYASPPSPPPGFKTSLTLVEPLPTVIIQMSPPLHRGPRGDESGMTRLWRGYTLLSYQSTAIWGEEGQTSLVLFLY